MKLYIITGRKRLVSSYYYILKTLLKTFLFIYFLIKFLVTIWNGDWYFCFAFGYWIRDRMYNCCDKVIEKGNEYWWVWLGITWNCKWFGKTNWNITKLNLMSNDVIILKWWKIINLIKWRCSFFLHGETNFKQAIALWEKVVVS